MKTLGLIFLFWNLVTFFVTGYDKLIAGKGRRRIPEKNLMGMSVLMGAAGVYTAMKLFRHKTKHAKFKYGVPFLLAMNIIVIYFVFFKVVLK